MKKIVLRLVCALGVLLAFATTAGACIVWAYQPPVPKELIKK